MIFRKLIICLFQLCVFMMVFTIHTDSVYASEKNTAPFRLVLNLNDVTQIPTIKEALINSLIDYTIYPELAGNIDFEASELKTASLNINQPGIQKSAVQLVIKTSRHLSENSLFKGTISTMVEFDVQDLQAPVLSFESNGLRRSINAELDPYQNVQVSDNSKDEVRLSYITNYDNQTPGEYFITYTATDSTGNTSTLTQNIVVSNQKYTNYNMDLSTIEEMFTLINDYRASYNLEPFELAPANAHHALGVRACEAQVFLSHDRPDGRHYKTTLNEYGVEYTSPYEVLAYAGSSALDNLNWWKNSPDHNARLLTTTSNTIAIGTCNGLWAAIVYTR